jgi:hypothetical protein
MISKLVRSKLLATTILPHIQWMIEDPEGRISIKGMMCAFIWLCSLDLPLPPFYSDAYSMPIVPQGHGWGIVGVTAIYQALRYLELRGPLQNQEHLAGYICWFPLAKKSFAWGDIVLAWKFLPEEEDDLRQDILDQVYKYITEINSQVGFSLIITVLQRMGKKVVDSRLLNQSVRQSNIQNIMPS